MNKKKFNYLVKRITFDKNAYVAIYDFYFHKMIMHYSKIYGKEFAEDAVQKFFFERFKKIEVTDYIVAPMAWLCKCCDYVIKDIWRNELPTTELKNETLAASLEIEVTEDLLSERNYNDDDAKYFKKLLDAEWSEETVDTLRKLGKEMTEIFIMHYIEKYSLKEIAKEFDMNYDTLKSKFRRGGKYFKKIIKTCTFLLLFLRLLFIE